MLEKFNFEKKEVRVVLLNNEPWFVAKDIAEILEYQKVDTKQAGKLTFRGFCWLVGLLEKSGYKIRSTPQALWDEYCEMKLV